MLSDTVWLQYLVVFLVELPFYYQLGKIFFDSWDEFFDAIKYLLQPDLVSLFCGEWMKDNWATLKLFLFFLLCLGALLTGHRLVF